MSKGEQETSDFASKGTAPFPYTHEDNQNTASFSAWPETLVRAKRKEYETFLKRTDIMQRARNVGGRILRHLEFEDEYNKGDISFTQYISDLVQTQQMEHDSEGVDDETGTSPFI